MFEIYVLHEDVNESLSMVWTAFKALIVAVKGLIVSVGKGMKLPEIGRTILAMIKKIPFIGKLIPDKKGEEQRVQETVDTIMTGDVVAGTVNLLQRMVSTIWTYIPLSTKFKNEKILPIFNYNDRMSYIQSLYKIMVDNDIEVKYAKAFLVIICSKIPIYQMMYVWKPFWSKAKTNPTTDDKIHPWTAGDPYTNPETGLNEMELLLQKKVQHFIQIGRMEIGDLERKRKLSWEIIKESVMAILSPMLIQSFNFFKLAFGMSDDAFLTTYVGEPIRALLVLYYYYFLITSLILMSLAVDNEESFHPTDDRPVEESDLL